MIHFTTHEIGSLAKPEWRVKVTQGKSIGKKEIDEAVYWGKKFDIAYHPLIKLLRKKTISQKDERLIRSFASVYAVGMLEKAGLDIVYDGEQQRSEMYHYAVNRSKGFVFRGLVRSFDNKYYQKAACIGKPHIKKPWHVDELSYLQTITKKRIKIPITGAYTIATWSFDEYYSKKAYEIGTSNALKRKEALRREFVLDVARNLIRPNIKMLLENGAEWIQIDEPAAATIPSEISLFVESFNESVKGLTGEFSVHICFSDYTLLFPHIQKMKNCSQYALELSNRDSKNLGTKDMDRPGYAILKLFKKYHISSRIGLGVTDIHSNYLESPELIRDRILYAVRILGDPKLVDATPDCGLRTRTWEVAFHKLSAMVQGAKLAEKLVA
jgi:5-methyltetrahydropteroyltriglutamate--homocysteine methyltransferase